ncbi:MAG: nitroreductase family deazaflavin-dependent oxidoreductase, partial [Candidatus Dormibacteraeota bacterium]|nr:nitroreductase family deazaflavin-dependent oxidoreductase [Candidatus Dormibacteraeota bacterium]
NPITRRFAEWLPGFAIITYRGRKTGRVYRLPINIFWREGAWVVFLTYGSQAQWVQNVLAQGGCEMHKRGRKVRLVDPELIVDPARHLVPRPVRFVGRIGRVTEFLRLHPAPAAGGAS